MHYALVSTSPQLQNPSQYKVSPSGTTPPGKSFFNHYGVSPRINYLEFIKALEEKLNTY